ncbi:MAG: MFS transporter [Clostridiales bacterium]|jgi:fucose permease|nr:MFS transporter [Clostridiales bacterium]
MSLFFLFTIYLAYISLGLPDSIWGVMWPNAGADFGAPQEFAGYFTAVISLCSMVSAILSLRLAKKFGAGKITAFSCMLTGTAIFLGGFVRNEYIYFIIAVTMGFGAGAVDAVLNEYVSKHYSSKIMNWLHASWGIGAMVSPLILTAWINSGNWRGGFFTIGAVQILLAALFFSTQFLWKSRRATDGENMETAHPSAPGLTMKNAAPRLSVLLFFLYVGIEVSVGVWLKTLLFVTRGESNTRAGIAVSLYYASIVTGRIISGFISKKIGNKNIIRMGLVLALAGVGMLALKNYYVNLVGVFMIGAGFAPVYPCMMHETPRRFNSDTASKTIGFQMAAASAGAMLCVPLVGVAGAANMEALVVFAIIFIMLIFIVTESVNLLTSPNRRI